MFSKRDIDNNFREACDDSDKIFFEAFSNDFSLISNLFKDKQNLKQKSSVKMVAGNSSPFKN